MLYRARKKRFWMRRGFWVLIVFLIILCTLVHCFEKKAAVFGKSYLPNFAQRITTEAVSGAVERELTKLDLSYGDLVKLSRDKNGSVQSIETDSVKINIIKERITKAAQDEVVKIKHSKMKVPLGAFTGLTLLSNSGPQIPLTFCLTGSFDAHIESSFENAGINQTIHHIKLVVTSKIVTASVDYDKEIVFDTDYELAQSVIVGQIPTTYGGCYALYQPKNQNIEH